MNTALSPAGYGMADTGNPTKWVAVLHLGIILMGLIILPVSGKDWDQAPEVTGYWVNPPNLAPDSLGTINISIQQTGTTTFGEKVSTGDKGSSYLTRGWDQNLFIERVELEGNGLLVLSPDFDRVGLLGPDGILTLSYTIQTPKESGIYYPEIRIISSGTSVRYPIPVNVNTAINIKKQAMIIMSNSLPETVNPGDEIPVTITLENVGESPASMATIVVLNASSVIMPKTTNTYYLGLIKPGEQKSINVVLLSNRNANPGLVQVPVALQYTQVDGTVQTSRVPIDMVMKGRGEIGIISVDTNPQRIIDNQPFDITIRIGNTGTGKVKQVFATLDMPISGTKHSYIGKIDPGEDGTATFLMDGGHAGSYLYNASVTYIDDTGTHTETRQMTLRVTQAYLSWIGIPILLVIIMLCLFVYHYWYKRPGSDNQIFSWGRLR